MKILIADDSEFMRIAYKRILESQPNLKVVAMAADGEEAILMAAQVLPDVAILDIRMPKIDGIKVAHEILRIAPGAAIVVITAYDDLSFVADLMRNGSARKAYLRKNSLSEISEIIRVVEEVEAGHTMLDSEIVQKMARLYSKHSDMLETHLTDIEQDLLGIMAEGHDDNHICRVLHLDLDQVQEYSEAIYHRFGIVEGTPAERRIKAIQAFVDQLYQVPLASACDPVI
ncbi:MAG: response regulator transcription factor [Chloroflexi bacterium]|nr:response regulator transcription factor [Chloroflexota bacterium]